VDAATTRRPVDVADALALIDEAAGEVAEGMDAVLHLLLGPDLQPGDVAPLHALHEVLARQSGGPVGYRCFRETLVGSAKAAGRIEDNEDLASWRTDQPAIMMAQVTPRPVRRCGRLVRSGVKTRLSRSACCARPRRR
jgi:hypothetical protein